MASVSLRKVCKQFGGSQIVRDVDLDIEDGEFVVMVGPSGCGKSTLLNCIAGLEAVSSGEIWIGGRLVNQVPPKDRDIAMVFQSYALYPNMSVRKNITFGMDMRNIPRAEQDTILARVADMLQISHLLDHKPAQLSGGQRQRVAMGRAMVRDPALFLFDEPLSNLDAKLRVQMRAEIKALHQRLRHTVIYVTHDQVEAMTLGDRIVVMNGGRIEQVGPPLQLYDHPLNQFVAGFIGSPAMNFITGMVQRRDGLLVLATREGAAFPLPPLALDEGRAVTLGIRPEHLAVDAQGPVELRIDIVEPSGDATHLYGKAGDELICVGLHHRLALQPGLAVRLGWPLAHLHLFDAGDGSRLN
ncbi:sn-glycerol-3-phosphate ABC transporter ATP-binding protein UgpC [Chitinivorax sp. PXF-14]|uniref:ABC transporter ATP-binding protein n=1 Tax=Chitinivorax sp. PXF-14 TaxID=3230488 RepID=UPI00346639D5